MTMADNPLKVLFVSEVFYPHPGGISEHILYLWKNLRILGHDVKVLAPSFGRNEPYTSGDFLRIGRAFKFPKNQSFYAITVGLTIPWKVKDLMNRGGFDVIHIHGPVAPMLPYFALKYSIAKNFVTCHAAYEGSLGYLLWEPVLEQYFRNIDGLIAVSEVARDSVSRYFPGDYRIIPNGIDTDRFRPDLEPIPEMKEHSPNVLFVGRFEPRKGLKYLLQAFVDVIKEFPAAKLIVVGNGFLEHYYRRYVAEHIEKNVIFAGYVSPEDLPHYYASCDVFCSPAIGAESFGIVLLEAMATGKPVLAADIPGYRKVMTNGEQGLFFNACDARDCAVKLITLLKDENVRSRMGKNGRHTALKYDWRLVTKQVVAYYHEVLDERD
jgi:phosphatidylinositol alpha-mannosyltransferase